MLKPKSSLILGLGVAFLSFLTVAIPTVSAQTQYVSATPGYINLGMTTTIQVTGPSAATYTVVVDQPNGAKASLDFTFTSVGQVLNATYGNSTTGFMASVGQVGTYNVFLEQGGQVVSSTSFYATNKLEISMLMVTGGTCDYVSGVARGEKMFPHIYITYSSNGAPMTIAAKGASVSILTPTGHVTTAGWDPYAKAFEIGVLPNWNYTYVGPWIPAINASDAAGNAGAFKYSGGPFVITPVQLNTSIQVVDATTNQNVTSLYNGQSVIIKATITYPTNVEPVEGFVGPLDAANRGGLVTAQLGWGYYNATSGTFGGKNPGGLLGTVPMTYTKNGTWTGPFLSNSLPKLPAGGAYEVVVSSRDKASPSNAGFAMAILSPAINPSTALTTTSITLTATTTSLSITTQNVVQTVESIPTVVYAALAILLIVGLLIGYIVRVPR